MKRLLFILLCVLIFLSLNHADYSLSNETTGPQLREPESCIGGFCLRGRSLAESDLVQKYGSGSVKEAYLADEIESRIHCFYDPQQKLWITFHADFHSMEGDISEIFVSKESLCDKSYKPKKPFPILQTSQGIKIGASYSAVIDTYGKPFRIRNVSKTKSNNLLLSDTPGYGARFGSPVLIYAPEGYQNSLLSLYFQMKEGSVHSIFISISE